MSYGTSTLVFKFVVGKKNIKIAYYIISRNYIKNEKSLFELTLNQRKTIMAMFLQESHTPSSTSLFESMEDVLMTLASMGEEQATLTESLLRADFIISERARSLTEAEAEKEEKGFFSRAWAKIKEVALKIWQKIKDVCRWVREKVMAFVYKLKGYFTGKDTTVFYAVRASKSKVIKMTVEHAGVLINQLVNSSDAAKAEAAKVATNALLDKIEAASKDTSGDVIKMKYDDIVTASKAIELIASSLDKVASNAIKGVNLVAAEIAKGGNAADKKEVEDRAKVQRELPQVAQKLASAMARAGSYLMSGAERTTEQTKK